MLQRFDERNRDLVVNVNGRLVHRDDAGVSPFDSVVQGGDAVWEGLRLYSGRIFRLEQHLDRLIASARALAFAEIPPREHIVEEIRRHARGQPDDRWRARTLDAHARGVKITSGWIRGSTRAARR
jgi:branched-chain amino acid aminotransferase